uniref:Uncharacterized protein n=1 Tax=Romanomermis culicivorax TaxID=13658 RepID=A0A915JXS7_ROMCU
MNVNEFFRASPIFMRRFSVFPQHAIFHQKNAQFRHDKEEDKVVEKHEAYPLVYIIATIQFLVFDIVHSSLNPANRLCALQNETPQQGFTDLNSVYTVTVIGRVKVPPI